MKIGMYTDAVINAAPLNMAMTLLDQYTRLRNMLKDIMGSFALDSANTNSSASTTNPANNPRICHEFQAYVLPPSSRPKIRHTTAPISVTAPSQSICWD
ncbi:hypothetical protein D3C76_1709880 [compost metagenome]